MTKENSNNAFYKAQSIEIELRGRCIRFSANVEANLMRDILLLNEAKFLITGNENPLNFKELMFHKKIELLEYLLKEVFPDLLKSNVILFQALYRFKDLRNKMTHSFFVWDEYHLDQVILWDIEKGSDKIWRHYPIKYTVGSLEEMLRSSMKEIISDLNSLSQEIIERIKPNMPYLFDKIQN